MRSLPLHNQRGCLVHDAVNDGSARSLAAAASIAAASSIVEACPPRSTEGWSRANPMCTPLLVCSTIPLAVREMRWTKPLPGGPRTARPADAGGGKAVRASARRKPPDALSVVASRTVPVPLCRATVAPPRRAVAEPARTRARPTFRRARAHSQSSDAQRMSDSAGGSSDEPTSTLIGTLVAAFKERLAGGSKR